MTLAKFNSRIDNPPARTLTANQAYFDGYAARVASKPQIAPPCYDSGLWASWTTGYCAADVDLQRAKALERQTIPGASE